MKEMETDLHFKAEIQTQTLLSWSTERNGRRSSQSRGAKRLALSGQETFCGQWTQESALRTCGCTVGDLVGGNTSVEQQTAVAARTKGCL